MDKKQFVREIKEGIERVDALKRKNLTPIRENRKAYTNQEVFTNALEILVQSVKTLSIAELMENTYKTYELSEEEKRTIEQAKRRYDTINRELLYVYQQHSKNTEELA